MFNDCQDMVSVLKCESPSKEGIHAWIRLVGSGARVIQLDAAARNRLMGFGLLGMQP